MSQDWNISQNTQNAKAIDFALVIAGWPTIYSVSRSYTLPSSGDLSNSSGSGFDAETRAWTDVPNIRGAATGRRPEEGVCTSARADIDIIDHSLDGTRALTEFCSRRLYDAPSKNYPQLKSAITNSAARLELTSIEGFNSDGGFAYVGSECLHYSTAYQDASGSWLDGCTRGRLLTSPMAHGAELAIYSSMPSLQSRSAFLYKGYQNLALDQWVRAFGGVVAGVEREGSRISLSLADTLWLASSGGEQSLIGAPTAASNQGIFRSARLSGETFFSLLPDRLRISMDDPTHIGNGHYLLNLRGTWLGVKAAV